MRLGLLYAEVKRISPMSQNGGWRVRLMTTFGPGVLGPRRRGR